MACRTRGGKPAAKYHTPRFVLVPALRAPCSALREELEIPVPDDRLPLKRLARNAAEPMTLSAELRVGDIQLELLTGPLTDVYDPNGMGAMFFAVLAVAGQTEGDYIREKPLEGQVAAASKGLSVASLHRALAKADADVDADAVTADDGLPPHPKPARVCRPMGPVTAEEIDLRERLQS